MGFYATAFLFHLPGLKLFYKFKADKKLKAINIYAIFISLLLISILYTVSEDSYRLHAAMTTWLICHLAWGAFLVLYLKRRGAF